MLSGDYLDYPENHDGLLSEDLRADIEKHKDEILSADHEAKRIDVLAHFDKPEYRLPKEENGELMVDEKMWLVGRIVPFLWAFPEIKCFQ